MPESLPEVLPVPPRSRSRRDEEEDKRPRRPRRRDDEDEPQPPRRRKRSLSIQQMDDRVKAFLVGGLVLVVLVSVGIWYTMRTVRRSPFRNQMASYLAQPTATADLNAPRKPVKRMVVVDPNEQDLDDLHFDLPDDLRAATPADVTTVVWLRWNQATVGTYSSGGNAYQWSCDVMVIDLPTRTTIGSQHFDGAPPPARVSGKRGQSHSGDKPTQAILNYLQSFPRS
jgi:hypothetical protein